MALGARPWRASWGATLRSTAKGPVLHTSFYVGYYTSNISGCDHIFFEMTTVHLPLSGLCALVAPWGCFASFISGLLLSAALILNLVEQAA